MLADELERGRNSSSGDAGNGEWDGIDVVCGSAISLDGADASG